jgi:hypothetical protein
MPHVTHKTISIRKLFDWFDQRSLAVPELQREFVWNAQRACALLDSIYKGYPIGNAMIWKTGTEHANLLRHSDMHVLPSFDQSQNSHINFLIDGQQRLSVLHQVRRGETIENSNGQKIRFGDICFNLEEGESRFVYVRRPDPATHFKVSSLVAASWSKAFRNLPKYKLNQIKECRERLLSYHFPLTFVTTRELEDVRETFIRINTRGMRITEADRAFSSASRVRPLHRFRQLCRTLPLGYDGIDKGVYWTTLVLARGIEDLGQNAFARLTKQVDSTPEGERWFGQTEPKVAESIKLASDYLVDRLKVFDFSLLPYENMVSLLALFFFWNNRAQPNKLQREQIRRWFWHTAVLKRYAGSGYRRNILSDAAFFKRLGETRRGRYEINERAPASSLLTEDYRRGSALSRSFQLLLAAHRPRYITNGEEMPLGPVASASNAKELHHIWPRDLLKRNKVPPRRYHALSNICYLVAHDNRSFGAQPPRKYLEKFQSERHFGRAMRSHLIVHTTDSAIWDQRVRRGFNQFIAERSKRIQRAFNEAAGAKLFDLEG